MPEDLEKVVALSNGRVQVGDRRLNADGEVLGRGAPAADSKKDLRLLVKDDFLGGWEVRLGKRGFDGCANAAGFD